jgi:glycosyltransferase involved in cell wall biosynthesis
LSKGAPPDVRLELAGDGVLRPDLERLVRELGLEDAVTFRGYVGHDALLGEIRAGRYDAMALTSLELPGGVMEGIPVALMEAMALGLPVLTTATGSITELVDDGCGRVVPQGDAAAIAAALRKLAGDAGLRARIVAAAHARVRAGFDVATVAAELARRIGATVAVPWGCGGVLMEGDRAERPPAATETSGAARLPNAAAVTREQATGRRVIEDAATTQGGDAVWGQG